MTRALRLVAIAVAAGGLALFVSALFSLPRTDYPIFVIGECITPDVEDERWNQRIFRIEEIGKHAYRTREWSAYLEQWIKAVSRIETMLFAESGGFAIVPCPNRAVER